MPAVLQGGPVVFGNVPIPHTGSTSTSGAPSASSPPGGPSSASDGTIDNSIIPGASQYAQAALAAKKAYQEALAQINGQRQTALQQYGYKAEIDPNTGTVTNMVVDPNNPYGLFEQMLNSHATASDQAKYSAEARGLGHGGLAAQGITAEQKSFGADSAQLGQSLMSQLEGLQQEQTSAQNQMNDSLYQAELQAARDAIMNQMFDTPDFSGIDTPVYGDNTPYVPPAAGQSSPPLTQAQKNRIVAAAVARGEPLSEHGLGQGGFTSPNSTKSKKKALPNAYLTNKNKRG